MTGRVTVPHEAKARGPVWWWEAEIFVSCSQWAGGGETRNGDDGERGGVGYGRVLRRESNVRLSGVD